MQLTFEPPWFPPGNRSTKNGKENLEKVGSFRAALAIRPDSEVAHVNLGVALAGLQDYTGAIHHLREALKHDPELARAHSALGGLLTKVNDVAEARRHQTGAMTGRGPRRRAR